MSPRKAGARIAVGVVVLLAAGLLLSHLPVREWVVAGARAAHGAGALGVAATGLAIYLLTLAMLPIVPMIVAAGWLYGPWGAALALPASVLSASTAFAVSRALGRRAVSQALLDRPKARALAELVAEGGVTTVVLIRLSPILPFTPSNAVMGLTPLRLRDLALGTAIGMAPGTALYAWAGSLLPSAEAIAQGEALHGGLVWVLLAVAFAAALVLGAAATKRLRKVRSAPPA